jgi:hypothetical protein
MLLSYRQIAISANRCLFSYRSLYGVSQFYWLPVFANFYRGGDLRVRMTSLRVDGWAIRGERLY